MTQKISAHQMGAIAGILFWTLKMSTLPSLAYEYNGTGSVLSAMFVILLNFGFLWLIVWIKQKYNNLSLYGIFSQKIGVFLTKLLYFVFFAFFILKLLLMLSDSFTFIRDVADDEFSILNLFICFLPVITALAYSGIKSIGRTAEFFYPLIAFSLILLIVFAFVPITNWGLGSLIQNGFSGFFNSIFRLSFYTGDLFALLIFLDKLEIQKGKKRQLFIPFCVMALLLLVIYIVYYIFYQETSMFHTNVLNDIVQYAIGTSGGWHMDIFAIVAFMFNILIQGGILLYCANDCLKKLIGFEYDIMTLIFINILLIGIESLYLTDYLRYVAFAENVLCYFAFAILLLIPLILIICLITKKGKKNELIKKNN